MADKLDIFKNNQTVSKLSILDQAILLFEIQNKYVSDLGSNDCNIIASFLKELKELQEKNGLFQRTINALIGQIQEMEEQIPKWNLCKDELPTDCENVLVDYEYFRYGDYNCMFRTVGIAYYSHKYDMWHVDGGGHQINVHAWMELPKFESEE